MHLRNYYPQGLSVQNIFKTFKYFMVSINAKCIFFSCLVFLTQSVIALKAKGIS